MNVKNQGVLGMKRTALCAVELEHTSADCVTVLLISLGESASALQKTSLLVQILRQAADLTTTPPHFATTEETVRVGDVSAKGEKMIGRLYPETSANVITSPATDTKVNSALGLTTESVSAGSAIVMKSGTWRDTQLVSARLAMTLASAPTENMLASFARDMEPASVENANVNILKMDNMLGNSVMNAQPVLESVRS